MLTIMLLLTIMLCLMLCLMYVVPEQRGFHSHSMAHDPKIKKEMAEARKIAREDVDDALE